jgi:hypothetical protein
MRGEREVERRILARERAREVNLVHERVVVRLIRAEGRALRAHAGWQPAQGPERLVVRVELVHQHPLGPGAHAQEHAPPLGIPRGQLVPRVVHDAQREGSRQRVVGHVLQGRCVGELGEGAISPREQRRTVDAHAAVEVHGEHRGPLSEQTRDQRIVRGRRDGHRREPRGNQRVTAHQIVQRHAALRMLGPRPAGTPRWPSCSHARARPACDSPGRWRWRCRAATS